MISAIVCHIVFTATFKVTICTDSQNKTTVARVKRAWGNIPEEFIIPESDRK